MKKRGKIFFKAVAYLVFLFATSFILIEVFLTVTNFPIKNTSFEYEPDMGFRTIPYQNNSNYFGFNDKDYPLQKPEDVYRIVVLGDSFNWIGGRDHNYVTFLQRRFSERMPDKKIEVINAGYIGTHTGEQLLALKKYAMQYDPDLVVLGFFAGNDFIEGDPDRIKIIVNGVEMNTTKGAYLEYKNFPIIFKSRLLSFVMREVKFKIAIPKDKKLGTFTEKVFLALEMKRMEFYSKRNEETGKFAKNSVFILEKIKEMDHFLKENKTLFFVGIFPDQFTIDDNLSEQIFKSYGLNPDDYNLEQAQEILIESLSQEKVPFLDLTPRFKEKQKIKNLYLLHDTHWNRAGSRTAASQLYDALKPIVEKDLKRLVK